ncbi:hypothetical protein JAAARDRAFT_422252 [Jaapia argillacea MUCL 33604]|uniref:Protein transport protein SEC31 n=1 Tax=Jaapia argillacea MUCL 33604 TaxID=933084 RepID=A0A067PR15_9AGAM|nr:hypothetical protein JAAARDRAFT_422252 [Jaapia argillacea MUCL 33604]
MKLKEIHRTSTFAWSPSPSLPLLVTGTVAGALDESFSNDSILEIWAPDFLDKDEFEMGLDGQEGRGGPKGVVTNSSRFNRIAWGAVDATRPRGVIAAGMESGELGLWDPSKILAQASDSLILRNSAHTGPVRGLDFNPIQTSLFSSGAVNGEIYIWDLHSPSKPYSPGTRSQKLHEITSLAWNNQVAHVLATSSSTGYTVVWDLRGKREVVALAYGGGAGTLAGGGGGAGAFGGSGGRRGMSDVAWQPDNATRLVTCSEDDSSPVVMVWDLRNARAPEKILTGHEKGVLSLSWCKEDPDLLLSCGKDNRALCWNPQTSEIVGELPIADNWAFEVQWCPRNPDLFAAAFFDGTIGIHSVQSTNEPSDLPPTPTPVPATAPSADGADIFDLASTSLSRINRLDNQRASLTLKQAPKWLRRPISAGFGYGGKLVSVCNLPGGHGKNQSSVVHLRTLETEGGVVRRMQKLKEAIEGDTLNAFAQEMSSHAVADGEGADSGAGWKALLSLFRADSRDELVTLLGFSKAEVAARVAEAINKLKVEAEDKERAEENLTEPPKSPVEDLIVTGSDNKQQSVVSFAEPEPSDDEDGEAGSSTVEATPSEISAASASASANSDTTSLTQPADAESVTTTAPSLFGDDNGAIGGIGTPHTDAAADFFSSMGLVQPHDQMVVPHMNYALDSSVAATIGSGPSSVASESLKSNTFRIYPKDEDETDRLVTKALVLGDFESAVSLCLSSDRFADAILLAVRGGPELLQRTQKAYFERRTTALPYLRLFQSIVTNDLSDIAQNADLREWQEIFVVLCTFASAEEFGSLTEQLGQRLEFQSHLAAAAANSGGSGAEDASDKAREFRRNATLTYLAAGRLERLVNIWIEELAEEEDKLVDDEEQMKGSRYTAHAHALQSFIEKVTVFRKAANYVDSDLSSQGMSTADPDGRTFRLAALYDRYFEYADLLAGQGRVQEAVKFLKLTPLEYSASGGSPFDISGGRDRLLVSANVTSPVVASSPIGVAPQAPALSAPTSAPTYPYNQWSAQGLPPVPPSVPGNVTAPYQPYAPTAPSAAPRGPPAQPAYQQPPPAPYAPYAPTGYAPQQPATYAPQQTASYSPQQPTGVSLPPPPRPASNLSSPAAPPTNLPPPPKRSGIANGGWNDAPVVATERRTPNPLNLNKPQPIVSPFPNALPSPMPPPGSPYVSPQSSLPPPPRAGSAQLRQPPGPPGPPPQRGPHPSGMSGPYPPPGRTPSAPPAHPQSMVPHNLPPQQMVSPPPGLPQGPPRGPPPAQFAPPPHARGHVQPSPSQHPATQAPPSHMPPGHGPGPASSYMRGTPPPQQAPGPYAPPPSSMGAGQPPLQQRPQHVAPPQGISTLPSSGGSRPPPPPAKKGPPAPKYPPGDRSHIPPASLPIYNVISEQLGRFKQIAPPQIRMPDFERRINVLFDALNCETLSPSVVDQLVELTQAMAARDRQAALAIHTDLLTKGSVSDDIGLWMSSIKQLILRL